MSGAGPGLLLQAPGKAGEGEAKTSRFALIYRVNAVKRPQTRERKINEFVTMLARYETIYPQEARPEGSPRPTPS